MNQRRWVAIIAVAVAAGLLGGLLTLLDGNWLSAVPMLLGVVVGGILLHTTRKPGWAPPRRIPRWRIVFFWGFLLLVSSMFVVAAFITPHTERRWIAGALVVLVLAIGAAFTAVYHRINSSTGQPE